MPNLAPTLSFAELLASLNPNQRLAVETLEGPVMVLAGPGTGKTQVLAARVANLLQETDLNPSNILALTFTEAAAHNMRTRLVSLIGSAGYQVEIGTFHSFALSILQNYPEFFPLAREAQALSDVEQYLLIRELIASLPLQVTKPIKKQDHYFQAYLRAIGDLKREAVSPKRLAELIEQAKLELALTKQKQAYQQAERRLAKQAELLLVYQAYQAKLRELDRYDFEDMVGLAVLGLEQAPPLLTECQEKYHYLLVDEYQDTNSAQNRLLELLSQYWGEAANLFVVGDPQQSIYRFQGASLENISWFRRQFPNTPLIQLEVGYRCSAPIYQASFDLIHHQARADTKVEESFLPRAPLQSSHQHKEPVLIQEYETDLAELDAVAKKIRHLLTQGVAPNEIAVLYRTNREVERLEEILTLHEIPYSALTQDDALAVPTLQQFLNLFRLVVGLRERGDESLLLEVLCYDWVACAPLAVMKLIARARQARQSIFALWQQERANKSLEWDEKLEIWLERLISWPVFDLGHLLPVTFVTLLNESGLLTWLREQPHQVKSLLALQTLFTEVKQLAKRNRNAKLAELIELVTVIEEKRLSLRMPEAGVVSTGVTLSTIHKAKGLEWSYVFVTGLTESRWSRKKQPELLPLPLGVVTQAESLDDQEAELRRLLYVAMTRAKLRTELSFARQTLTASSPKAELASQFLLESEKSEAVVSTQVASEPFDPQLLEKGLSGGLVAHQLDAEVRAYLQHLVEKFSLSASSLNNYLEDPLKFFYRNLLHTPQIKEAHLGFGSAIHSALEALYQPLTAGRQAPAPLAAILAIFETSLAQELISTAEWSRWLSHGRAVLEAYYQHLPSPLPSVYAVETNLGRAPHFAYLDDFRLTGKIDRIDWLDEAKRLVRVVDYKTGRVHTRTDIEASTPTSQQKLSARELALPSSLRGRLKRQMVFYQLLAELTTNFPGRLTTTQLEFVEPKEVGRAPTIHQLIIEPTEVEALKEVIREVMAEIRGLAFLPPAISAGEWWNFVSKR